ncbi:pimeloyl-ACP methyl ester carboxylesterase [Nocardioides sp. BE266]|uniref:alpha/beta fold hydrolase n=1 Tax=Nocardioides sp. BE266 TaxID=2817725 RepID=UPI00285C0519|nr:alpha/beta hydrolase [Nocardioides sp. BE266]MDR7251536.1 pimeloyl-ACP methyl ester carboxylesterase [Nocardioides sp. BE266]
MRAWACAVAVVLLASGCTSAGSDSADPPASESPAPTSEPATSETAADPAGLHLDCAGEGGPAIVLVAGLNTSGGTFADLRDRLAEGTTACFYDRAGIGLSPPLAKNDPDPSPGSAAADLRKTLSAAGVEPPYVVLGWSYGGLVAQAYAKDFPDDLAGLVLEDPSVREQFVAGPLNDRGFMWREGGRTIHKEVVAEELAGLDLGDLPVAVISQDSKESWIGPWYRAHDRLARATTDGIHAIGLGSGHAMHDDVPGFVARAVQTVWSAASAGTPLPACRAVFATAGGRCRV